MRDGINRLRHAMKLLALSILDHLRDAVLDTGWIAGVPA